MPAWDLKVGTTGDYRLCQGSAEAVTACLIAFGVVIPAGSLVVSGSVVLVGNTLRWVEYHGSCDEGAIGQTLSRFRSLLGLDGS